MFLVWILASFVCVGDPDAAVTEEFAAWDQ